METFIAGLRWWHQFSYNSKQGNGLISPAVFDPSLSDETSRGLANIRAIWGIWLDNDGGDLTHQEFARLFPRLRIVVINSYSGTRQAPRWRVFIPTTVAMPIAAHRAIAGQIMRTLNKAGFWSKKQLTEGRSDQVSARPRLRYEQVDAIEPILSALSGSGLGRQLLHRP